MRKHKPEQYESIKKFIDELDSEKDALIFIGAHMQNIEDGEIQMKLVDGIEGISLVEVILFAMMSSKDIASVITESANRYEATNRIQAAQHSELKN